MRRWDSVNKQELEAAHCWEADDRVPMRPGMTDFRRSLRYHQAQWREANGHPVGSQPIRPIPNGGAVRLIGSRLPLAYARETGANFLTAGALDAARARTSISNLSRASITSDCGPTSCRQRRWPSTSSATWPSTWGWPAAPSTPGGRTRTVCEVRFAHSPGRLDRAYLGNLMAFDVAFVLALRDGTQGVVGLDTKYHERTKRALPKPSRLPRYLEVAARSGVFGPEAIDAVNGTDLLGMWLEHLLVLSMLQHPSGTWNWGRYVVVHPAGSLDFAEACARYGDLSWTGRPSPL